MDIMLTSFGLGMGEPSPHVSSSGFNKLPPLVLSKSATAANFVRNYSPRPTFTFDYAALLMFDRVLIDTASYEQLMQYDITVLDEKEAADIRIFLAELENSGRLVARDFMMTTSETRSIWQLALEYDLNNLTEWTEPLESSLRIWNQTLASLDSEDPILQVGDENVRAQDVSMQLTHHHGARMPLSLELCLDALRRWKSKQEPSVREYARQLLEDYLSYVNINIALAYEFDAAFIDWADFEPFYRKKFNLAGQRERPSAESIAAAKNLIEVVFPYFLPCDMKQLVRVYEDARIEQLRQVIQEAVEGKVEFDADYAASTLREVLKIERKSAVRRKISGWATLPLGIVPIIGTGLQKSAEEAINVAWADRPKKKFGWFYLIDELCVEPD